MMCVAIIGQKWLGATTGLDTDGSVRDGERSMAATCPPLLPTGVWLSV